MRFKIEAEVDTDVSPIGDGTTEEAITTGIVAALRAWLPVQDVKVTRVLPSTLGDWRDPAIICRERGWEVGTVLKGDEGYGWSKIQITAIGEHQMLAVVIEKEHGISGFEAKRPESSWTLACRDWEVVE